MFDHLIRGGRIVDGTGAPWFRGDIALEDGRIAAVGDLGSASASRVVEANDKVVAPGFIDAHVHSDLILLEQGGCDPSLRQGVTTHIIGQDGISYAPLTLASRSFLQRYFAAINGGVGLELNWSTVAEFLDRFERTTSINVAYLVPHGTVRAAVMGLEARGPSTGEIRRMQALVEQGLADGAVGVSTGLDYLPCLYASTRELVEIARPAAGAGVFVSHMRDYVQRAEAAIEETLEVGRQAGLPVHISHFNCRASVLPTLERGRRQGVDITFDAYPYLAGSTVLMLALPRELHLGTTEEMVSRLREPSGDRWLRGWLGQTSAPLEDIVLVHLQRPEHQGFLGMSLVEAAAAAQRPLAEFVRQLLIDEEMQVGVVIFQRWRSEEDLLATARHPGFMVGSDGIYVGQRPHPRGWGAFARFLGHYVRERGSFTLEGMVHHMTAVPANRFRLFDRGLLRPGMAADVVIFDADRIADRATFENGRQYADGVTHVWVNGEPVLENGRSTGARPGRPLRQGG